jgi:hypothetical protein
VSLSARLPPHCAATQARLDENVDVSEELKEAGKQVLRPDSCSLTLLNSIC